MTFATILELITLVLKFPDTITKLVKMFKDTPQEQHEKLIAAAEKEKQNFKDTGRPQWD